MAYKLLIVEIPSKSCTPERGVFLVRTIFRTAVNAVRKVDEGTVVVGVVEVAGEAKAVGLVIGT